MSVHGEAPPTNFKSFCLLKMTALWEESEESAAANNGAGGGGNSKSFGYRLLTAGAAFAYLYDRGGVRCHSAVVDNQEPDVLDFSSAGNAVLGAGTSESGAPLFFTANQGLVAVTPTSAAAATAANASVIEASFSEGGVAERASSRLSESLSLSVSRVGGIDGLAASESKSDQLKAAFLLFCKREIVSSHQLRGRFQLLNTTTASFPERVHVAGAGSVSRV